MSKAERAKSLPRRPAMINSLRSRHWNRTPSTSAKSYHNGVVVSDPHRFVTVLTGQDKPIGFSDPERVIYICMGGGHAVLHGAGVDFEFNIKKLDVHRFVQIDVRHWKVSVAAVYADGSVLEEILVMKITS